MGLRATVDKLQRFPRITLLVVSSRETVQTNVPARQPVLCVRFPSIYGIYRLAVTNRNSRNPVHIIWSLIIWFSARKSLGGGGQKTIVHCFFQNNRLAFLLFFLLLFENFRGGKSRSGGRPPVAESQN